MQEALVTAESIARLEQMLTWLELDRENRQLGSDCIALALRLKKHELARQLAKQALSHHPNDPRAVFDYASTLMGLRQFDEALALLGPLAKAEIVDSAVWQNIGLCQYLQESFSESVESLEKVFASGNRSADFLRVFISALHHIGDTEKALDVASVAESAAKLDAGLAGVLALLYLDASQASKAAIWSSRALSMNPESVDGLVVRGTLQTGSFDQDGARKSFDRALAIAPSTGRAWVGLSLLSLVENDLDAAQKHIENGIHHMPSHIGTWHLHAWIQLLCGNLDQSHASFEKALHMNRNFAESHGGLAAIAAMKGDRVAAEKHLGIAERLDANCLSAKFARSVLIRGAGDSATARNMLLQALGSLSPANQGAMSKLIADITKR